MEMNRSSANISTRDFDLIRVAALSAVVSLLIFVTVLGNLLVILIILIFRSLRTIPNMFIVSLASADLIMGAIVLPMGAHYVIAEKWLLGDEACYAWISIDILSVTASIGTLSAIAIDRFIAIVTPFNYEKTVTRSRARGAVALIWLTSSVVAFVPIHLGWWKSADSLDSSCYENQFCCEFLTNKTYALVSSLISFYIPLVIMIWAYSTLHRVAKKLKLQYPEKTSVTRENKGRNSMTGSLNLFTLRREIRHLFTSKIVLGIFVACWLPFFIINIMQVFCHRCVSGTIFTAANWLGYTNSLFNPFIYCHQQEFRRAFKKLLTCDLCKQGYRVTSRGSLTISYTRTSQRNFRENIERRKSSAV